MMTMYKLLKTQCNYSKKQIFVTVNQEITETIKRNQVIHKIRYLKEVLQNSHQKKRNEKQFFKQDMNYINIKSCYSD